MNRRIKELAEQAGLKFRSYGRYGLFDEEKFAELIVLECASICYNSGLEDSDTHAMNLMFHFNVFSDDNHDK